jgi:glycyl-tRNA synthetase beta chain
MNQKATNGFSFLLEIGTEDLPARFIPAAVQQLRENAKKILNENHIKFSEIKTFGTPQETGDYCRRYTSMQEDRTKRFSAFKRLF